MPRPQVESGDFSCLRQHIHDRLAYPVVGDVEGALLDYVRELGGDAERVINSRVQVLDDDGVLDGLAGALVRRPAVDIAFFDAATEEQDGAGVGEVAVHPVVLRLGQGVWHRHLVLDLLVRLALGQHVAAELARQHDERSVEEAALFQV